MNAEKKPGSVMAQVKFVAVVVVIVLIMIIMFQNIEPTPCKVLFWSAQIPLFLLPLVAFCAGGLGALLVLRLLRARRRPQ